MEDLIVLNDFIEKLKTADGFMLTASIVNGSNIEHTLLTDKFNKLDMISSYKKIRELIIKELEDVGA